MRYNTYKYFSPDFVSLNKPFVHILYAVNSILNFCERKFTIVACITSLAKTSILSWTACIDPFMFPPAQRQGMAAGPRKELSSERVPRADT